jgi:hypothetical protein
LATGRSLTTFERVYIDGFDMSGYVNSTGEQGIEYPEAVMDCLSDAVTGVLVGKPKISFGPFVTVLDNTPTSGVHVLATAAQGTKRNIMLARGVRGVPAIGDDTFCAPMIQKAYKSNHGTPIVTAGITFAGPDIPSAMAYARFWGKLLHAWGSETGTNSANTNSNNGAASTAGGWLMYQVYSITGAGTVTLSIDDSDTGSSNWVALSGATSGAIATASAPTSGIVQLATNATVRQYLRPQWAFGGSATAALFALAFMRG